MKTRLLKAGAFFLSDKSFIRLKYRLKMGRALNLSNPRTFTEKIQWLKLFWRDELATQCCDKYEVRKLVQSRIGPEFLNELYGAYHRVQDIDLKKLPDSFVLKVNHGSGQQILCKDKKSTDWNHAFTLLECWLKENHYYHAREWGYKNVHPRIICERYLEENGSSLTDYKFYCYNGVPRFVEVHKDRFAGRKKNTYDMNWNLMEFRKGRSSPIPGESAKPPRFTHMFDCAAELSKGFPFVRVDLYCIEGKVIFGELTLYPGSGLERFRPDSYDWLFGSYLKLPLREHL